MWRVKEFQDEEWRPLYRCLHDDGRESGGSPWLVRENCQEKCDTLNATAYKPGDRVFCSSEILGEKYFVSVDEWRKITDGWEVWGWLHDRSERIKWGFPERDCKIRPCTPAEIAEHWPEPVAEDFSVTEEPEPRFKPGQFIKRGGTGVFMVVSHDSEYPYLKDTPSAGAFVTMHPASNYCLATNEQIAADPDWGPSYKQPEERSVDANKTMGPWTVELRPGGFTRWGVMAGADENIACFVRDKEPALDIAYALNTAHRERTGGGNV